MTDNKENGLELINVLVVEPGKEPYVKAIKPCLASYHREVGGYIEAVYPFEEPVAIVCNDEGKLNGLPLNRALRDSEGKPYDVIAGTFLVVGLTEDDFGPLNDEQIKHFSEHFKTPEAFVQLDGKLVIVTMENVDDKLAKAWKPTAEKEDPKTHSDDMER